MKKKRVLHAFLFLKHLWPRTWTFQEELGIVAARMLKASAKATGRPGPSGDGDASSPSAAEKAERLLRGLQVILPAKEVEKA